MKYLIGEQVINRSNGELEIIEDCELISDVMLYYTISGKSFVESQLSRHKKTVEDVKEIVDKVINILTINLTIKNPELFTTESIIKSLEEIKKERLEK